MCCHKIDNLKSDNILYITLYLRAAHPVGIVVGTPQMSYHMKTTHIHMNLQNTLKNTPHSFILHKFKVLQKLKNPA